MAGFQDIVGHEQIIRHLKNAIFKDQVSHAYILDGPDHSGKRMIAEAFAMALQCGTVRRVISREEEPQQATLFGLPADGGRGGVSEAARERARLMEPCMECRSCRQAEGHNQPDIIYVTHEKTDHDRRLHLLLKLLYKKDVAQMCQNLKMFIKILKKIQI